MPASFLKMNKSPSKTAGTAEIPIGNEFSALYILRIQGIPVVNNGNINASTVDIVGGYISGQP